jgi:hypothetical protein
MSCVAPRCSDQHHADSHCALIRLALELPHNFVEGERLECAQRKEDSTQSRIEVTLITVLTGHEE